MNGKRLRLSHLPKVLFPEEGITKVELFLYFQIVAPVFILHLRGRPVTLKAFLNGVKERPYCPAPVDGKYTQMVEPGRDLGP